MRGIRRRKRWRGRDEGNGEEHEGANGEEKEEKAKKQEERHVKEESQTK